MNGERFGDKNGTVRVVVDMMELWREYFSGMEQDDKIYMLIPCIRMEKRGGKSERQSDLNRMDIQKAVYNENWYGCKFSGILEVLKYIKKKKREEVVNVMYMVCKEVHTKTDL